MRGDAFFGDVVHLFGANLHLEGLRFRADDGGVQRLIEIIARRGDPILDASGHWTPVVVNDAERGVTMTHFIRCDDTRGN